MYTVLPYSTSYVRSIVFFRTSDFASTVSSVVTVSPSEFPSLTLVVATNSICVLLQMSFPRLSPSFFSCSLQFLHLHSSGDLDSLSYSLASRLTHSWVVPRLAASLTVNSLHLCQQQDFCFPICFFRIKFIQITWYHPMTS